MVMKLAFLTVHIATVWNFHSHLASFPAEEVGHDWTLIIKMAEATLIDFSYLNRLTLSTFTEGAPSFQIKI